MRADRIPLYLFARKPVPGRVKTRLQPALGRQGAAVIAERMLRHSVATMAESWPGRLTLAVTSDLTHPLFQELAATYNLPLVLQRGESLGDRMLHMLKAGIIEAGCAAVVGSDIPHIDDAILRRVHGELALGNNVLGPAADGGFYLLGLQQVDDLLFDGVSWGTSSVQEQVVQQATALGLDFSELPVLRDIDNPDDLAWLVLEKKEFLENL